jgi:hypothetical protein
MHQNDNDSDGLGDVCDPDDDNDGFCDPGEYGQSCTESDNCPNHPNGPEAGTCIWGEIVGAPCMLAGFNPMQCGTDGFCSMHQEDLFPPGGNGIGEICDCEGNFDCDQDVDARDITTFLQDFGRNDFNDPCESGNQCNGDFSCDGDVDADDVTKLKEDFGKNPFNHPCPVCDGGDWCVY